MTKHFYKIATALAIFTLALTQMGLHSEQTATATATATLQVSVTPSVTPQPSLTPTPIVQKDADPQAWLDGDARLDAFPAKGALTVHFNAPMLPGSSPSPLLVWPALQAESRWNADNTQLTFIPAAPLDSKKTYTFFVDPALQSAAGKTLKNAPEWTVHVQPGPQVVTVSPAAGTLTQRFPPISVIFDQDMNPAFEKNALTIEPAIAFETRWKDKKTLEIVLQAPFEANTRYDLTLSGLLSADGNPLTDDYRWFYATAPFEATVSTEGVKTIKVKFSQPIDRGRSGLPFAISPALTGNWKWDSPEAAIFTATENIPTATEYTLSFTAPLTDADGAKTAMLAPLTFTGFVPMRLMNEVDKDGVIDNATQAFNIRFDVPVNHASAEKAFSLTPAVPGTFKWETDTGSSGGETMTFALDGGLLPSEEYTLQVNTSIQDQPGQPLLAKPYIRIFRIYQSFDASFGESGENIQVIDANGPRKLQIQGKAQEISFSAYRFDLIDFAKLYAKHYRNRRSDGIRDIPIPADLKSSARWTNVAERKVGEYSVVETTLPTELAPGLYVLNLRVGNTLYDQMFIVVTQNTLVVKQDGVGNLFVWLTNINGENVPNAEIRLYSKTGEKIREGQTDAEGQYRVSIPAGAEPMLVSAHAAREKNLPDDVTLAGFDGWVYSGYNYGERDYYYSNDDYYSEYGLPYVQPYMIYAYTERPIYRPGQTVNFKALIRRDHDVKYEVPPVDTPVKVEVLDARGNLLETLDLRTNRYGSVNGAFTLSEGAMLGTYSIDIEVDGVTDDTTFKVQDYRKPDYQIKITSLQPEKKDVFVVNEAVQVNVNVSYYFGEPLTNTSLKVELFQRNNKSEPEITGSLITDANGNATFSFPASYSGMDGYYYDYERNDLQLEVSADDGSNQVVSAVYAFEVLPAAEKPKIETDGYYFGPNTPINITNRVVDLLGQPVPNRELTLTLEHWDWSSYDYDANSKTYNVKTDAQGTATQEVTLESGYYQLALEGKDEKGNVMKAKKWLYIFKEDGKGWQPRSRASQISISAEKDAYKPYEKARFLIESSFSGPALLSFERGSVVNTKMIQLTAPLTVVETDVIPEYAPNIYVMVNTWQSTGGQQASSDYYGFSSIPDSRLRRARTQIKVESSIKALNISIQTDKKTYAPGEKVNVTLQVSDADGKPAPAELSLAVVDESIFALADDLSGDIFTAFYGPRRHSVDTYNSMAPSRYIIPGMGGGGGGLIPQAARSDFLDTSAWLPVIETDDKGQATLSFDLPDNTTSWRLTAKAITLNQRVGQALTNIETKKDIFVRPSLPRVLTSGDQATLAAFVHNYGTAAQTVTVNLAAAGLDLQGPNDQQITLQPGDVQAVGWRVAVSGVKPTEITITVKGADSTPLDAVRLPLLIQPAAVKDIQTQSGQFTGNLTLALPLPNVQRETSLVRLTLNRSMAGTLLNGLEYLTGYPYGCVEQTMSRALPNAVVSRAASQLGVGGPTLQNKVDPYIKAGIQKLYGFQHADGGWGWWTDDPSDAYETAWVLYGLGIMNQSGYPIAPTVMEKGAKWLENHLRSDFMDVRTQAYALYSMAEAGYGNKEKTLAMLALAKELDPFSQAALALALDKLGEKAQAQSVLALLSQSALQRADQVYWPQPDGDGEYHRKTMASSIRTTALVLLAYTRIEPKNPLLPGIVAYLAGQRQGVRGWGTTNETSFTILGLTEYLKGQQEAAGSTPYEVSANGTSLFTGTLEAGKSSIALDIPLKDLKDGVNNLLVSTQGSQPLYYDLSTLYDLLQTDPKAAGKIKVTRSYLDAEGNTLKTEIKAGQLVKVLLEVQLPEDASFMAVEDYLPGGLEALNEGLNTVSVGSAWDDYGDAEYFTHYYWEEYGYNYKEIRGDRVVFFITSMGTGTRYFSYYARATTAGEFATLPTQVYAMYDQTMWGRSTGGKIVVKP